jgi:UTP--glucose-1-phosphate uridylyltransferase
MLPLTKAVPKEMLPVGRKPLLQHAIDEAVASGITEIVLVVAPNERIIREYFQRDPELERILEQHGRHEDVQRLRFLSSAANILYVCQDHPLGLGHAIGCARDLVGEEPFAVILPDAVILGSSPCIRQLIETRQQTPGCYLATREIPLEDLGRFGILDVASSKSESGPMLYRVKGLIEKPNAATAPSRFGIFGRYLFEPRIFEHIEKTAPDAGGEIQLTAALAAYCSEAPVYAVPFIGEHFDAGNRLGLMEASVASALSDPAMAGELREFLAAALSPTV